MKLLKNDGLIQYTLQVGYKQKTPAEMTDSFWIGMAGAGIGWVGIGWISSAGMGWTGMGGWTSMVARLAW